MCNGPIYWLLETLWRAYENKTLGRVTGGLGLSGVIYIKGWLLVDGGAYFGLV